MNDYQPWEFTCKTCGDHSLTVTHIWAILAGPDNESWQECGPLESDHFLRFNDREKIEKEDDEEDEVERGDFGEFAEDDSVLSWKSTKYSNRRATRKVTSFM